MGSKSTKKKWIKKNIHNNDDEGQSCHDINIQHASKVASYEKKIYIIIKCKYRK